ncbi:MAG: CpsB/CapC family capsule biosynthesis tyrosine phosphatase, partial [Solirubrobacteraceae bacterium]
RRRPSPGSDRERHAQAGEPESMSTLIDLHCHILPGIDDGARDLDDAVAMARQAQSDGITAVCATPHIRADHDVRIGELPERRAALAAAITTAGCATEILAGGEVASAAVAGLSGPELAAVSLGGGHRWILLEPAPGPLDDRLVQAVASLRDRGFRALVAHPERHLGADYKARMAAVVSMGAMIQATAATFTIPGTREGMLSLAMAGLIHVVASDAHSAAAGRPVAISEALRVLSTVAPVADHLDWLARTAPTAIVAGAELSSPFPVSG